MKYNVNCIVCK